MKLAGPVVGVAGLACGAALAVAAKVFHVDEDPRIEKAVDLLPGANCGGCGYAGCADYAKAVVEGADLISCGPGGATVVENLALLLGKTAEAAEPKVAVVLCGGDSEKAGRKFQYNGIADCKAAAGVGGGDKKCTYGCLGYGSCANVCPTETIQITENHLAVVHPENCIACGACVRACPRGLIRLVPESRTIHVLCSSKDKGPVVKKGCSVGCIGCTKCSKICEAEEIQMDGPLAVVDYTVPLDNVEIVEKCPTHCIVATVASP